MKPLPAIAAVALLALTAASAPARYDWGSVDLKESYGFTGEYLASAAKSQAACRAHASAEPPAADWPTPAERAALKGCDSEELYYGITGAADPVKARKCALIEREAEADPAGAAASDGNGYFSGSGILAMAYATGTGAKRDLAVAIHMACAIEDAPAATEFRIESPLPGGDASTPGSTFDMCDAATSGASEGFCTDHAARITREERKRRVAALVQGWTPAQRALFAKVQESLSAYAELGHEMACYGGTAHAACAISGADADEEDFLRRIEALAAGRRPGPRQTVEGESVNIATGALDLSYVRREDRQAYRTNYAAAGAARGTFEGDLIAFMKAMFPRYTAHEVRVMFRDL